MLLIASRTFSPSSRTPMTTSSEMEVALRSSRTRTTVPSRISRTIGSVASERALQASQSLFTFRQTRLTTSLPTPSANSAFSARRTRRVGPGKIGRRDQGVSSQRTALVGPQRLALPLRRRTVVTLNPGAGR